MATLGFTSYATSDPAIHDLVRYARKGKPGVVIKTPWGFVHIIGTVIYDSDALVSGLPRPDLSDRPQGEFADSVKITFDSPEPDATSTPVTSALAAAVALGSYPKPKRISRAKHDAPASALQNLCPLPYPSEDELPDQAYETP